MDNMDFLFKTDDEIRKRKFFVVICYDISDNKRRIKFVKYLEKFSIRVQKSVFEGYLNKSKYLKLKKGIEAYLAAEDKVRVYKLTGNGDVTSWGNDDITENEDVIII